MHIKDSGAVIVAGQSLLFMMLNAWISFRPQASPKTPWRLPPTWRSWAAAVIRLALAAVLIWLTAVILGPGFNWSMAMFTLLACIISMRGVGAKWRMLLVLLWCVILYCALQYPSMLSAQLLWVAPQLAMMGVMWRFMLSTRSNGQPRYALFYLPFWLGLVDLGALADTVFRLDARAITRVISSDLGPMPPAGAHTLNTVTLNVWTSLFYAEQPFSIGVITLYTSFMLMGVLAVWARWFSEPILIVLPVLGWIIGTVVALGAGWQLAALPVAVAMTVAILIAVWAANVSTILFRPLIWL